VTGEGVHGCLIGPTGTGVEGSAIAGAKIINLDDQVITRAISSSVV